MKNLVVSALLITTTAVDIPAQAKTSSKSSKSSTLKYADDFLINASRRPTQVMLLGLWHFDYPNADSHKTSDQDKVDVLTEKRQREIG